MTRRGDRGGAGAGGGGARRGGGGVDVERTKILSTPSLTGDWERFSPFSSASSLPPPLRYGVTTSASFEG